jgi:hypothetical protein
LKRLPEVGGLTYERRPSYMQLVSSFLQVLDSTLPTAHVASRGAHAQLEAPGKTGLDAASRTHTGYLPKVCSSAEFTARVDCFDDLGWWWVAVSSIKR